LLYSWIISPCCSNQLDLTRSYLSSSGLIAISSANFLSRISNNSGANFSISDQDVLVGTITFLGAVLLVTPFLAKLSVSS